MAQAKEMTALEWGLLLGLSVVWGGSFFFIEIAVRELPPFTIVATRLILAALALHVFLRLTGRRMPSDPKIWAAFVVMGLMNNAIPFSLLVWGQTEIASGLASILNATTPLFAIAAAHFLTDDERLTPRRLAGALLGLAGVAVLIGGDAMRALDANIWAQAACLGAALSYALAGIFGRRFRRMGVAPMATATGQVTMSSLILIPLVLVLDAPWTLPLPSTGVIACLAALGLVSTALAYVFYFRILSTAGATNLMLVTLLVPVTAILLGALFLEETLAANQLAGLALIALGLAAIDGRPVRMIGSWARRRKRA